MEAFIGTDQYNFIRQQVKHLVSGYSTAKDEGVIDALKSMVLERVEMLFENLSEDQEQIINQIVSINDREKAGHFFGQLKAYVIPFQATEQGIKKLFPKVKKLKVPSLEKNDLKEITYLSWYDSSMNKKFIVLRDDKKLDGVYGSVEPTSHKGICSICNGHEEVSLFLAKEKGPEIGTFKKKGNYICRDSKICNQNITSQEKLKDFINRIKNK